MRISALRFVAAGLAIVLVYPVLAQQPQGRGGRGGRGGFGGPGMMDAAQLLLNKSVQDELKLTDDQKAELGKVSEKQREAMQKAFSSAEGDRQKGFEAVKAVRDETKKEVDKWKEAGLKPEQAKRLRQIEIQPLAASAPTPTPTSRRS